MKTRITLKNGDFKIWLRVASPQPLCKGEGVVSLQRMTFE